MKACNIFVFGLQNKIRVHTQYERVIEVLAMCDNMFENQWKRTIISIRIQFLIQARHISLRHWEQGLRAVWWTNETNSKIRN